MCMIYNELVSRSLIVLRERGRASPKTYAASPRESGRARAAPESACCGGASPPPPFEGICFKKA